MAAGVMVYRALSVCGSSVPSLYEIFCSLKNTIVANSGTVSLAKLLHKLAHLSLVRVHNQAHLSGFITWVTYHSVVRFHN